MQVNGQQKIALTSVCKTESAMERMRGLLGSDVLNSGEGLLISSCGSVHTLFMGFTIDVVFLNRQNTIIKIIHKLKPFRFAMAFGASAVLELQAGEAKRIGMKRGNHLVWIEQ